MAYVEDSGMIMNFNEYINDNRKSYNAKDIEERRKLRAKADKSETILVDLYNKACKIFEKKNVKEKPKEEQVETIDLNSNTSAESTDHEFLEKSLGNMTDQIEKLKKLVAEKDKLLASAKFDRKQITKELEKGKHLLAEKNSKIETITNLEELPKSLLEVVELIEAIFPEKIGFSEEARKSAEAASKVPINIAWPCLFKMATTLHDLFFVESEKRIDIEKVFYDRTGLGLAMTEGKQTKRAPSFLKLRTIVYEGKEISIVPHVKSGVKKPKLLRVHFFPDRDNKRIIVGHCGDHLDNYSTQSLK